MSNKIPDPDFMLELITGALEDIEVAENQYDMGNYEHCRIALDFAKTKAALILATMSIDPFTMVPGEKPK